MNSKYKNMKDLFATFMLDSFINRQTHFYIDKTEKDKYGKQLEDLFKVEIFEIKTKDVFIVNYKYDEIFYAFKDNKEITDRIIKTNNEANKIYKETIKESKYKKDLNDLKNLFILKKGETDLCLYNNTYDKEYSYSMENTKVKTSSLTYEDLKNIKRLGIKYKDIVTPIDKLTKEEFFKSCDLNSTLNGIIVQLFIIKKEK